MKKKLFTLLTLMLCVCSGAWADTETLSGADATSIKDTEIAKTSFTMLSTYNPSGNRTINNKSTLKVRFNQTNTATGNATGFALKVNEGYTITGLTMQVSGNGKVGTLDKIDIDGTDYTGTFSTELKKNDEYSTITLSNISATNYINFVAGSSSEATQLFVYITVTYEANGETVTLSFPSPAYSVNLDETFTIPSLTVTPTAAASEVVYSSSNTDVATVDESTGAVTLIGAGKTTITAAVPASIAYKPASAQYLLTVIDPNVTSVTATFPFDLGNEGQVATVSNDNVFSVTSVGVANMTYAGIGSDQGITGTKLQPTTQASDDKSQFTKFTLTPKKGITFTPTKISFDAMRWGTDGSNKLHYYAESGSTSVELGDVNPNRNGKGNGWSHYEHEISGITATKDNPFSLACYIYGLSNSKQISFANVVIEGEFSGEAEDETMYSVSTSVTPEGAGSVMQDPAGASLTEGTAVTFSATANSGYVFLKRWTVNGTEVNGETYSVESLSEDIEVVAQFQKLFAVNFNAGDGSWGTSNPLTTVYTEGSYTTPAANYYIAREGYTVTGWTDGNNNYAFGEAITLTSDITLNPIFVANTKTVANTTISDVVITYGFDNTNGAPVINIEGSTGYYVKQAQFDGETIDVPVYINNTKGNVVEGKSGKTYNVGRSTAQINNGTMFTIPAVSGMKVSFDIGSGSMGSTTIAGEAYTASYTYTGDAPTIDVIFNLDNSVYLKGMTVTYPKTRTYIDVTSVGYRTFASSSALDFTEPIEGLTAYRATVAGNKVSFTAIDCPVPVGEGMLIKAAEGRYYIPLATGTPDEIENEFVGVTTATVVEGAGIFVLMNGSAGVGFYQTTAESFTVGANTAYLPADIAEARTFIGFDNEANGISEMAVSEDVQGKVFNMQGVRVAQPTKGLYIVNGKKVVVK